MKKKGVSIWIGMLFLLSGIMVNGLRAEFAPKVGPASAHPTYYSAKISGYSTSMLDLNRWNKIVVRVHNKGKQATLQVKPSRLPPSWSVLPKEIQKVVKPQQDAEFTFKIRTAAHQVKTASAETKVASAETKVASAETKVASAETKVASAETKVASAETKVASAKTKVASADADGMIAWALNAIHEDGGWHTLDTDFQMINPPQIEVQPAKLNLEIRKGDGDKKSHDFLLKNTGRHLLHLRSIVTSCGCTSAVLKRDGKGKPISPSFGGRSHNKGLRGWKGEDLQPGESLVLTVTYDPLFHKQSPSHSSSSSEQSYHTWHHPEPTELRRTVYIKSNDPGTPELQIPITIREKKKP